MKAIAARRHHKLAPVVLLALALLVTGVLYAAFTPSSAQAAAAPTQNDLDGRLEPVPGELCDLPRRQRRGARRYGALAHRGGRRRRRLPGQHRAHAADEPGRTGPRQAADLHRGADPADGRVGRLARPGPGHPRAGGRRPGQGRRGERHGAVPHQLRDVPRRGRPGRCAHRGQVRPEPGHRVTQDDLRGHGDRPAVDAGVQRREPSPRRRSATSSPTSTPRSRARPAARRSARSVRSPRACGRGSPASAS